MSPNRMPTFVAHRGFGPSYGVDFAQKGDMIMSLLVGGDKRMLAELKENKQW